ncbi:GAF domain-containing protein [Bacteroides sp. 519]|uniref:GAF domain-containing protein n=1 Tax=Bacteroides sp. 519 TaxID=2302937 RepID=UPI0013D1E7BB|nr:GAF domain-containing protein [Bacteroides sp. 519]NDV58567.1 GAF domain-containing protein [Bacteroides sp. 519]
MAEELYIPTGNDKEKIYTALLPQIKSLTEHESDLIANLANVTAVLKEAFNFFWVGFYFVKEEELVLGPFQGPLACTRIKKGKGVCGSAWRDKKTYVVPDVEQFPGHIACSSLSQSEIVIPLFTPDNNVWGVMDIDSELLNTFDYIDEKYLEEICYNIISPLFLA